MGALMQEHYYVGAYWGPRKETAQECAQRAERFFPALASCDPSFAQWYQAGRGFPRELPGHPLLPQTKELETFFLKGRNRANANREVIEDLGFHQIVWNEKKSPTDLHISCGGYSPWGAPNSCWLDLVRQGPVRERLLRMPVLAEILTSIATAWDPDYGIASSTPMVDLVEQGRHEVRVGWLTYLSRRLGNLPPLPAPVRIEPVGALGWLLVLSPEPMTANNPEHVAFTLRIRELLDRAGLIERPRAPPKGW